MTLGRLHDILQLAIGWTDSHLHAFEIGDSTYGPDDGDAPRTSSTRTRCPCSRLSRAPRPYLYEYDFGDGWSHRIVVEGVVPQSAALKSAVRLGGEGACPPENVGGPGGYAAFLAAMGDSAEAFDPTHFDVAATNIDLQRIR